MTGRFIATMTTLMVMGVTTAAHAQQATSDSLHHDRMHDQRMITRDTVKLTSDVASRDSVRSALQQDQAAVSTDKKQIDSLETVLAKARKATPRDTAAINRDEAALAQLRKKRETALDKTQNERKRLDVADKTVKRERDASIDAHKDIRGDHPKAKDSTVKTK